MLPQASGAFRLFRFAGIQVYVHWTWFIGAYIIYSRGAAYSSPVWQALECLTLFAIVTLHEFGHALACRSVGGTAEQIILWPLGGVAYVDPPNRPGALLWSIAAGPLVNVVLFPITLALDWWSSIHLGQRHPDLAKFIDEVYLINQALLVFNILPIYPLDGGQIFQSILWFFMRQSTSLKVASSIGMAGAAALMVFAFFNGSMWLVVMGIFLLQRAMLGFRYARYMDRPVSEEGGPPPLPRE